jgi:hypothetical protein
LFELFQLQKRLQANRRQSNRLNGSKIPPASFYPQNRRFDPE